MCLIIANPECKSVPAEHISRAFSTNHDGFGVMWYSEEERCLKSMRGMFPLESIKHIFAGLEKRQVPYVAHFRFATHGTKNQDNCHPFMVGDYLGGVGMVHNGTLTGSEWRDSKRSDTAILVDKIRGHIASGDFSPFDLFEKQAPHVLSRYGSSIGSDKLVFMSGLGHINIVNEQNGDWLDGIWYSNTYSIGSSSFWNWEDSEDDWERYTQWMSRGTK